MNGRPPEAREAVSEATARRLSIYLRGLEALEAEGIATISSQDFARRIRLNSAQIRKDLALFGEFGIRGVGYDVSHLHRHVASLLGLDRGRRVIICGAGHLGQALAGYPGFNSAEFRVVALFDVDPEKIGRRAVSGAPILDFARLPELAAGERIDIAVLAVPAAAAQRTCDAIVAAGIRAILNFSPARLAVEPRVLVKDVDLKIPLETLSFYLRTT